MDAFSIRFVSELAAKQDERQEKMIAKQDERQEIMAAKQDERHEKMAAKQDERQGKMAAIQEYREEKNRIIARLSSLNDQARQYRRDKFLSSTPGASQFFQSEIDLIENEIESMKCRQREHEQKNLNDK
jgi:uncharacterized coiled-coil DUF342 family protein